MLSKRIQVLSESMTLAITALAKQMKANGKDVLSFSAGEPDFDTPQIIKDTAIKAIYDGFTKYTAVVGAPDLVEAIQFKLKHENGLDYETGDIISSVGAKQSLFNLMEAVIDNGDEVIIPSPYWVTYPEIVKFAGGSVVEIQTNDTTAFKITPEQLKNAITHKTKLLILNSPSNPTGSVYIKEDLQALSEVLKGTNVLVAADEMYEKLLYDGLIFTSAASISKDMFDRTITINGLSKSVAMTGWRFGYMACPIKKITNAVKKLQSQSTSNINSITQKAAIPALLGHANQDIEMMRVEFEKRRNVAVKLFNEIEGLNVVSPNGAFYLFVNIKKVSNDSLAFCKKLLESKGVATVPGIGFGSDGYFRFSFATSTKSIEEGILRIREFIKENY